MESNRSRVHLRAPGEKQTLVAVVAEGERTLVLAPPPDLLRVLRAPAQVDVGWMTGSGMAWCGGVVLSQDEGKGTVRVRLIGTPVAAERRRHVRLPLDLEVEVFVPGHGAVAGRCVDLSSSGMQVVVPVGLEPGSVVRVTLRDDGGERLEATARVTRRIEPSRFGLAFELVGSGSPERLSRVALERAARAEPGS